jgi:hypothetical protein
MRLKTFQGHKFELMVLDSEDLDVSELIDLIQTILVQEGLFDAAFVKHISSEESVECSEGMEFGIA